MKLSFWVILSFCLYLSTIGIKDEYITSYERTEFLYEDPRYVKFYNCSLYKINRTTVFLHVNISLFQDGGYDMEIEIRFAALFGTEYKNVPLVMRKNLCDFFTSEWRYMKEDMVVSTFPTVCPIKKGNYYFIAVSKAQFYPKGLPWKKIRTTITYYIKKKVMCTFALYVVLDRDAVIANKARG